MLEYIIYLLTGIKVNRKMAYADYYEIQNYMHTNAKLKCPDTPTKPDIDELIHTLKLYKNCKKDL